MHEQNFDNALNISNMNLFNQSQVLKTMTPY